MSDDTSLTLLKEGIIKDGGFLPRCRIKEGVKKRV